MGEKWLPTDRARRRRFALKKLLAEHPKDEYARARAQYGPKVSPWSLGPTIKNRKPTRAK